VKPILRVIAGRPIHGERNTQQPPAPPAAPSGRIVRGGWWPRSAANAPMVVRPEEEKPADAVQIMDRVALAVLCAVALVGLWLVAVLVMSLQRVAS
jgi:hypothetical protein